MNPCGTVNQDRRPALHELGELGQQWLNSRCDLRVRRLAVDKRAPDPREPRIPSCLADLLRSFSLGEQGDDLRYAALQQPRHILEPRAMTQRESPRAHAHELWFAHWSHTGLLAVSHHLKRFAGNGVDLSIAKRCGNH